jgi:hypothetical protein
MKDEDNPLDRLIDRAVASYTPRESRPGLEYRILASVTAERLPWFSGWRLAGALASAALLLALAAVPAWFRFMQPGAGEARRAAVAAAVAVMQHPAQPASESQAVAAPAQKIGNPAALRAGREAEGLATARIERRARPATEGPLAADPIELKPITIAPIHLRVLN